MFPNYRFFIKSVCYLNVNNSSILSTDIIICHRMKNAKFEKKVLVKNHLIQGLPSTGDLVPSLDGKPGMSGHLQG